MRPQDLTKKFGSPVYAYDKAVIHARAQELLKAFPTFKLFYASKANTNAAIVRYIHSLGFGIECVSPGEIAAAKKAGVSASHITFTCGSIHEKELVAVAKEVSRIHLDSLTQLEAYGRNFPGRDVSLRLNLGVGAGHHSHVITGGPESKFGIDEKNLTEAARLAKKYKLRITGLHQHIGSNILDIPTFLKAMDVLFQAAHLFPDLEHLDFGGGFGVPYEDGAKRLSVQKLGAEVAKRRAAFEKKYGRKLAMSFEPGRYLVAESGTLFTTVVDIKKNSKKTFVGVDTGMGHLIRPAMYGSHHTIDNVSRPSDVKEKVTIAGPYCESGDILAKDRMLATPKIGDILAIRNAGAYGYAMSSDYNLRSRPPEVLLEGPRARLIRPKRSIA